MQKEMLSAIIDGEHNEQSLNHLIENEEWQQSWQNYHLIRDVMQQETLLPMDFSQQMEKIIATENLEEQPNPKVISKGFWQKLKPVMSPFMQVSIAASVCLVAVLGVRELNKNPDEAPIEVLETLPFNHNVQEVSLTTPQNLPVMEKQIQQKNKRMAEMIQDYELQRRTLSPRSQ